MSNNVRQTLDAYRGRAAAFWQARTEQERKFLAVGGAVVGAALFYAVLISPAMDGRGKLQKELPQLRQQAAELQALALEATALKGQASALPPPMSRDSLNASLSARGLTAQSVAITGEYAKLQLNGASFAALVGWLDAQRREGRITVQEASMTAQSASGLVDATLTLHQGGAK
ncbi:MAG: type II secretion system protein M [Paucibacter sp.]|nr:type II secretion system protein M [Roseateles sp.]